MPDLLKSHEAARTLRVHPNTLRRWASEGKIRCVRPPGKHRLYDVTSLQGWSGNEAEADDDARVSIAYCRVSSSKQRDDLGRQVAFMRERFPDHEIV